ncbi:DUF1385 domain-containing protein [Patescibacteria group bacterium]
MKKMKLMILKSNYFIQNWIINILNAKVEERKEGKMIDFAVGGQAVIEGVMMRSPNNIAIAVRKPDGEIVIDKRPYKTLTQRIKLLNIAFVRGVINLFEMMIVGTKALNFSASVAMEEEEMSDKEKSKFSKFLEFLMFTFSFIFALAFSIFLFKFIPLWTTTFLEKRIEFIASNYIVFNLIDGLLKMLIFVSYIYILTLFKSFYRVFEYHGAEHKSIHTYENKLELTADNAKKQTRFHPRCGTSFIFIVLTVSILIYTFVPKQPEFFVNLGLRVALLPLIAGISYEYLKLTAKFKNNRFIKLLIAPGLWFQKLSTKEPDVKQLEVGLKSLNQTLAMEKSS